MIDNLLGVVKQIAGDAVTNNSSISQSQSSNAIQSITDGIFGGLKKEATGGNLEQVVSMFTAGKVSNSLSSSIQTSVVNSLMEKIGIQSPIAKSIAAQVVPSVLGALSKGTSSSNEKIDVAGILGSVTGNSSANVQNLLDQNGDGKLDMKDVLNLLGKGGSEGKSSGLGDVLGSLGGLFGKK